MTNNTAYFWLMFLTMRISPLPTMEWDAKSFLYLVASVGALICAAYAFSQRVDGGK